MSFSVNPSSFGFPSISGYCSAIYHNALRLCFSHATLAPVGPGRLARPSRCSIPGPGPQFPRPLPPLRESGLCLPAQYFFSATPAIAPGGMHYVHTCRPAWARASDVPRVWRAGVSVAKGCGQWAGTRSGERATQGGGAQRQGRRGHGQH